MINDFENMYFSLQRHSSLLPFLLAKNHNSYSLPLFQPKNIAYRRSWHDLHGPFALVLVLLSNLDDGSETAFSKNASEPVDRVEVRRIGQFDAFYVGTLF